jgi:hypothetical protein
MSAVLAYLDPGTGSVILQIIAGGVAAVAVSAKLFWRRILALLHIKRDDDDTASGDDSSPRSS